MRRAYSRLPDRFEDGRHDAVHDGLKVAGFSVTRHEPPTNPRPEDVLVTWNAYGNNAETMKRFRRTVVCEEGYIRHAPGCPHRYFALALNGHNGSGRWPVGDMSRLDALGIDFKPWRGNGNHILVCGQRGFGYNAMAMPDTWPDRIYDRLRAMTKRPLWYRPHHKRARRPTQKTYDRVCSHEEPLRQHLVNCWAVVVYTSNAATEALIDGVPAFYDGPHIVTEGASIKGVEAVDHPRYRDRAPAFIKLSWAQWNLEEIRAGAPFARLLGRD